MAINQHKKMAMGEPVQMKRGGLVKNAAPLRKTGMPDSPMEKVKRANGIPGIKNGGKVPC